MQEHFIYKDENPYKYKHILIILIITRFIYFNKKGYIYSNNIKN